MQYDQTELSRFLKSAPMGANGAGSATTCLIDDSQHDTYALALAQAHACCRAAGVVDIRNARLEDVRNMYLATL